jgi:hypothetical protein
VLHEQKVARLGGTVAFAIAIAVAPGALALDAPRQQQPSAPVVLTPFGETNGKKPFNASAAIPIGDSRALIADNKIADALLELRLDRNGQKTGALVRRKLDGIPDGAIDDLEGLTLVEEGGKRFAFALSSMDAKAGDTGTVRPEPSGLVRIALDGDGPLRAEVMTGFRDWLVARSPAVAAASKRAPDDHGLNVEGIAWDAQRHALLLGLRTPLTGGKPFVLPVRIGRVDGDLAPSNLELLPPIALAVDATGGERGIRDLAYDAVGKRFLVLTGNAISGVEVPFTLYSWDGNDAGRVERFADLAFAGAAKVEGVATITVGTRPALLFVDDRGGYAVVWRDDPRLR